jgi:riboflavin synthase
MFTGLIKDVGTVTGIEANNLDRILTIQTKLDVAAMPLGASVACNGVCLTVTEKADAEFKVMVSKETLDKTSIADWAVGRAVNLEPSLKLGDDLGGHLVYGHVDAAIPCISITNEGQSKRVVFEAPRHLAMFIVAKGSVALDGISLTVNDVNGTQFGVNIIPHTIAHTNFSTLQTRQTGQRVNLEIDMLARYVQRMMETGK